MLQMITPEDSTDSVTTADPWSVESSAYRGKQDHQPRGLFYALDNCPVNSSLENDREQTTSTTQQAGSSVFPQSFQHA